MQDVVRAAPLIGIRPDLTVDVSPRLMGEHDGPTLEHGSKAFAGQAIHLPRKREQHPDHEHLELR
jgi:hypothetical protein